MQTMPSAGSLNNASPAAGDGETGAMTYAQACYALNKVYARHGATFPQNPEVRRQFERSSWYQPRPGTTDAEIEATFSEVERANVAALAGCRDQKAR